MSGAQLTDSERETLRELAVRQSLEHPHMITAGVQAADQLRQRYPGIGDEEMAAVIMQVAGWAARTGLQCRCGHMKAFGDLLGAVSADLAHLDVDAPDRS